ncbi:MAG: hypothetical protein ACYC6L_16370 [Anaerolineae bacterium]
MKTLSPDTSPEAERVLIELLRKMPTWRKLELQAGLNSMMRSMRLVNLRAHYPNLKETQLKRLLAGELLGEELAAKVYGPLPGVRPDE